MPSPFPGMDPYLEEPSLWPELHGALLFEMRAALNAVLPSRYRAAVDRYVWLHEPEADTRERLGRPDAAVVEHTGPSESAATSGTLTAPAVVTLPVVRREGTRYLRIVDQRNRRVVTVIELLSPSNKDPHQDRDDYLGKRNEYLATGTNLVEIDLLRSGQRLPSGEPTPTPSDYLVLVSRAADFPRAGIWGFSVRDPLPEIPVPLNPGDEAVTLGLKGCLDRAYDEARYDLELDYTRPPTPPLPEPDASWARELLARARPETTHQGDPS